MIHMVIILRDEEKTKRINTALIQCYKREAGIMDILNNNKINK